MRVLLDCRPVREPVSGVARYCIDLGAALAQLDEVDLEACVEQRNNSGPLSELDGITKLHIPAQRVPRSIRNGLIEYGHPLLGQIWGAVGFDIVHETYSAALSSGRGGPALVSTIHDTIPLDNPELFRWRNRHFSKRNFYRQIAKSSRVIAVSEFTRQRILEISGCDESLITFISNGVQRPEHLEGPSGRVQKIIGGEGPFIFHIGNIEPRKNLERLFHAVVQLRRDYPEARLVLAGRENYEADQILAVGHSLLGSALTYLGPVTESEKWHLLDAASALVFPSIYEGFGIPVLEAYLAATPTVMSGSTSLLELAVTDEQLFDPHSVEQMADALGWLLTGGAEVERSVEAGLRMAEQRTWADTALKTAGVYAQALAEF